MIAAARKTSKKKSPAAAANVVPGVVSPDELYRVDEFQRRMRLGSWAMRKMRAEGLLVRRCHGRSFVLGSDFIDFVRSASEERPSDHGSNGPTIE
jgi:hypothetical protein